MLDLFSKQPAVSVDASGDLFTDMEVSHREPEEIRDFMAEAYEFFTAFQ
ncbi:hypothetical protein [Rubripirellula reticaptiva]|uniref:Uncharacterized protein n=1 Tax=Rubripirellula reticaptiva TaxID=2528013 RepID=A0A5C6F9K0_9BACT|nr:hypothetical protein [Rubripirellula reticaptiva]TWU57114.1 hypothetical protein Poly59_00190 [Rubripirellula reticaptiva]